MLPYFKTWRILSPWNKTAVASYFSSMKTVFQLDAKIISKSSQSEIFSQDIEGKTYFVKRYFRSKNIGSWLGFSRFQKELRNQVWFNQQGIPSAKVVAYGESRLLLKTLKGVLITEGVRDTQELVEIAKNTPEKFADKQWRDSVIIQIAVITAQLHHARFCHNDLHWRNILVQQRRTSVEPKIFLIDCPSGKKFFGPLLSYRKLKDLANLDKLAAIYLTRSQRLRFFFEYRGIKKLSADDKKVILGVLKHKASRVRRKAKSKK
jgi:tRNA A-37 threonylcarbamoyl transferase component Bud32